MKIYSEKSIKEELLLQCGDEYHSLLNRLVTQNALEVLDKAHEYLTKRTILYYLEDNQIPFDIALTLLNSVNPLDTIYKKYMEQMKDDSPEIILAIKKAAIDIRGESINQKNREVR